MAVPGAPGKPAEVRLYDGNGDRLLATVMPFPGFEGSVNVAMGDVDGDGVLDLIVGAGKDHAPEVVVYAGRGHPWQRAPSGRSWRASRPFEADARGGVSVAAAQIDGTSADNIIVGSGPGVPSEVKVYQSQLPSSPGVVPALFASFRPYGDDRSGVSLATGFVDFSTGRDSIVTAPGPGSAAEVKVFAFPLLKPNGQVGRGQRGKQPGPSQPVNTASFMPFGRNYRGGVSLATGWLAGSLGGARADRRQPARGRRFGKGLFERLRLGRGPGTISAEPRAITATAPHFREIAELRAVRWSRVGTRVATTSTTTGANLLVSGVAAGGGDISVAKYEFVRPNAQSTTLQAVRLGQVWSGSGSQPAILGGD